MKIPMTESYMTILKFRIGLSDTSIDAKFLFVIAMYLHVRSVDGLVYFKYLLIAHILCSCMYEVAISQYQLYS